MTSPPPGPRSWGAPVVSDLDVRLGAIVDWLANGRITTEQAAARLRDFPFPAPPEKTARQNQLEDANGDPEPDLPGSFSAVIDAFAQGRIDAEQYAALAQAAAEAMRPVSGA